jgi:hypothetical protein
MRSSNGSTRDIGEREPLINFFPPRVKLAKTWREAARGASVTGRADGLPVSRVLPKLLCLKRRELWEWPESLDCFALKANGKGD